MRFKDEAERQQHPQAKIIPLSAQELLSLWSENGFYFYIFPLEIIQFIKVMQHNPRLLFAYLNSNPWIIKKYNKKLALVIALFCHEIDSEWISQLRDFLEISDRMILEAAVEAGNLKLVKLLFNLNAPSFLEMVREDHYCWLFSKAALGGNLSVFGYLMEIASDKFKNEILANCSEPFSLAARYGHLSILHYLIDRIKDFPTRIKDDYIHIFNKAAYCGNLSVAHFLASHASITLQDILSQSHYIAFTEAAHNGHLSILRYLLENAPEVSAAMIEAGNFEAYCNAASHGHLRVLDYLAQIAFDRVDAMISANNYRAFRRAALNGHLDVLDYLTKQVPARVKAMIAAYDYEAFLQAAINGHLPVLRYLVQRAPEEIRNMISCGHSGLFGREKYSPFRFASQQGHLQVLQFLTEQLPDEISNMLAEKNFVAFKGATSDAQLPVLRYLSELAQEKLPRMLSANDYSAFIKTAAHGDLNLLRYFAEKAPSHLDSMIAVDNYAAFRKAAENGHLVVVRYLVEQAPNKLQEMISEENYYAFRKAAANGHLGVLSYLAEKAPDNLKKMISADAYYAFRYAASNGHLLTLRFLIEHQVDKQTKMISANYNEPFSRAIWNGHDDVIRFLLSYPVVFSYAESNYAIYNKYIIPYIEDQLDELHQLNESFGKAPIHITSEKAKQFFYLARALIRRKSHSEDLRIILNIPEIKLLAHQAITKGRPNELLELSFQLNYETACYYLLCIPEVRRDAEVNGNPILSKKALNFRRIVQDEDSSMTALSREESDNLERLREFYLKKDSRDPHHVLTELRGLLQKRYEVDPAVINIVNAKGLTKTLALPFWWKQFQDLSLSEEQRERALKAYYSNKNHTAWRFLEKPNPWIFPRAIYCQAVGLDKWSYFESYLELIALLFLAAKDQSIASNNGFNFSDRINHFIDALSRIGRAGNKRQDMKGNEYDDLKEDKPGCYYGTKRLLLYSVKAHSLLNFLSVDVIRQKIQELVCNHFQKIITKSNYQSFADIWEKHLSMNALSKEEKIFLFKTNISTRIQEKWKKSLQKKYGEQFHQYEGFFVRMLNLSKDESHFIHFNYLGLNKFIEIFQNNTQGNLEIEQKIYDKPQEGASFQSFYQSGNQLINNNFQRAYHH